LKEPVAGPEGGEKKLVQNPLSRTKPIRPQTKITVTIAATIYAKVRVTTINDEVFSSVC
jgi:hypothetical protein